MTESGKIPQTELHRHLDISVRLSTLLELAQSKGLESRSTPLEAFRNKIILTRPLASLSEVIETFELFQKILDRPEILERVAFETVEDCYLQGTRLTELRFSPSFVTGKSRLNWETVLNSFEQGINRALERYPEMRAGLICIATREYGPEAVAQTVEFYLKHLDRFIGMDLAGNEADFPCRIFEQAFQPILKKKASASGQKPHVTIHAGEASGPENIWEAIELLGAERIGHGISSTQDPKLLTYLAEKRICLEICPTSNWITQTVPSLEAHPLPQFIKKGIPVSINTDDPGVFGCTVRDEIEICRGKMGLKEPEIQFCLASAYNSSFLR